MRFENDAWDQFLGEKLIEQATPVYLSTKAQLIQHYQQLQGEGTVKSWRQAIVHDLAAITGKKEKNLQRRFDPSRRANPEKKNAAEYAALGKQIGAVGYKAPPGGFKISWGATLWISKKAYDRSHSVTFVGAAAQNLLDEPRWWKVLDAYFTDGGLAVVVDIDDIDPDEESPVEGVDMIDYLIVEALEEE